MHKVIKFLRRFKSLIIYGNRLGAHKKFFCIGKGVVIQNPQCVYLNENVFIGANTFISPVVNYNGCSFNPKITIGNNTIIGKNNSIAAINGVYIGNDVLFAGFVHITDHNHGYMDINKSIREQPLVSKGPVIIGNQCWLGFNCEILSGVNIGEHSIVAARAVVTKDVPPYCIVAGNPAKIVKKYNVLTKVWEKV